MTLINMPHHASTTLPIEMQYFVNHEKIKLKMLLVLVVGVCIFFCNLNFFSTLKFSTVSTYYVDNQNNSRNSKALKRSVPESGDNRARPLGKPEDACRQSWQEEF